MRKQLSCLALWLAAPIGVHAQIPEQPKTPEGYYALGEGMGRCAAFFTFMIQGSQKKNDQDALANLAQRRGDWTLATEVFLSFGRAADAKAAGETIMAAEVNRLQARLDANSNKEATLHEMIDDHHKQCDPLESWRYGAVRAVQESIRNGEVVQPSPKR